MTKPQILAALKKLAAMPHASCRKGTPWVSADLVDQEALYDIQAEVLNLMLAVAEDCGQPHVDALVKAFPWAYQTTEEP